MEPVEDRRDEEGELGTAVLDVDAQCDLLDAVVLRAEPVRLEFGVQVSQIRRR